jgi:hypothetical protein
MNKLCISKLLQVVDGDLIPHESSASAPSPQPAASGATSAAMPH